MTDNKYDEMIERPDNPAAEARNEWSEIIGSYNGSTVGVSLADDSPYVMADWMVHLEKDGVGTIDLITTEARSLSETLSRVSEEEEVKETKALAQLLIEGAERVEEEQRDNGIKPGYAIYICSQCGAEKEAELAPPFCGPDCEECGCGMTAAAYAKPDGEDND